MLTLQGVPRLAALADGDDTAVALGDVLDTELGRVLRTRKGKGGGGKATAPELVRWARSEGRPSRERTPTRRESGVRRGERRNPRGRVRTTYTLSWSIRNFSTPLLTMYANAREDTRQHEPEPEPEPERLAVAVFERAPRSADTCV